MQKNEKLEPMTTKEDTATSEKSDSIKVTKETTESKPEVLAENTAGFWIRLQAHLIDGMLFLLIYLIPVFLIFKKLDFLNLIKMENSFKSLAFFTYKSLKAMV